MTNYVDQFLILTPVKRLYLALALALALATTTISKFRIQTQSRTKHELSQPPKKLKPADFLFGSLFLVLPPIIFNLASYKASSYIHHTRITHKKIKD